MNTCKLKSDKAAKPVEFIRHGKASVAVHAGSEPKSWTSITPKEFADKYDVIEEKGEQ